MQGKAATFRFDSYTCDWAAALLRFRYTIVFVDGTTESYEETLQLPTRERAAVPEELLTALLRDIHLVLGISYYKQFCPPRIEHPYALTADEATFWTSVYINGLGEFAYRNNVFLRDRIAFSGSGVHSHPVRFPRAQRALVGVGGGKESVVALELLKEVQIPRTAFIVETHAAQTLPQAVCEKAGVEMLVVRRTLDPLLLKKREGVLTGHVPISAMYAMIGVLCAALYDYAYVTVGNEASSNFGNVEHDGMIVNHQWSKSSVFERSYQAYLRASASDSVVYFSLLRPFHELRIAQLFSRYPEYFQTFASCNRNFAIDPTQRPTGKWCCSCPKCAFVFLMLAPFLPRETLIGIFGKNMLELKELEQLFGDILGFGTVKPFDCVGTFTEARAALYAVRDTYADTYIARTYVPKITDGVEAYAESMHTYPAPTIPTPFVFAGMRSAALLGYGLEGKTTEAFLKLAHPSCTVTVLDEKQGADLERDAIASDIAVRSPGVPLSKVSIQYTTATNLFFSLCRDTHTIVAVTGSKGKSTTSALIHHLLKEGGKASVLIGNAGVPVLSEYMKGIPQETIIVVELSSYQLEDMQYAPHIALVTSLFPDHIPHHGSVDVYYEAKHRMVQNQRPEDVYVYDPACARAAQWAAEAPGKTVAYEPALPIPFDETQLIGAHNEANMRGAVTVARMLDVSEEAIGRGLRSFVGLRHRLEHIGTFKDIRFYDDAIATTPEATIAALNALGTVDTIFLGGEDRGYDFSELARVLGKHGVKNVVLFPDSGERIGLDPTEFTILKTRSMKEAVNFAYEHTPAGGVCVLSCASPSYTLWKNFEEKGDDFTREVTSHA